MAITGVLCSVVSFTVGALLGALLLHHITRAQGKPPTKPHPPVASYEEVGIPTITKEVKGHKDKSIDLKSNEAYGPVEKGSSTATTRHTNKCSCDGPDGRFHCV